MRLNFCFRSWIRRRSDAERTVCPGISALLSAAAAAAEVARSIGLVLVDDSDAGASVVLVVSAVSPEIMSSCGEGTEDIFRNSVILEMMLE
jgi:hypothetical protein